MKKAVLALDQGTTSSRAILFDHRGQVLAVAQQEYPQLYPQEGWVEHDPQDIWRTQRDVAQEVLAKSGIVAAEVAAVGITNQRETTLLWDRKTGEPIANAIVWQDRRTAEMCQALRAEGREDWFRERTGLPLDPYFSGTKIAWLLDNVPGARERAERGELAFGTPDTWLIWQMTGGAVHVTDPTNASRTLLYNLHTGDWDDDLLQALNIPRSLLPQIVPSSQVVAETVPDLFGEPLPLAGIAGDQQAALFGQACHQPGMAKNTYGTGCFILLHTGETPVLSRHGLLTTAVATTDGSRQFALEGSVFIGGAVVQWLRDGLGIIQSSAEVEALALSVPDSGGVVFVPAFTGLGAPYWDPFARGAIFGMTRGTTAAHIARAAVEAIAFQSAEALTAMEQEAGALTELRVDGGAAANNLLMQFQADLMGLPVVRPQVLETTALGAAYLAGLAVGFWQSESEIRSLWSTDRVFEPTLPRDTAAGLLERWRDAINRVRR
ncbi:MAG: glycerol kinase GlpK [Armatimonadaceae bacterium]